MSYHEHPIINDLIKFYHFQDIENDVCKDVAKHITQHEDSIEEITVETTILVNRILSNQNTLNGPSDLRDTNKYIHYWKEYSSQKTHYKNNSRYQVSIEK